MASIGDQFPPEDMLIEILLRLPVKSLLRFKCVCKNWCSLIESHKFITNHYNHPNNQTRLLVIQTLRYFTPYFILFSDETLSNARPEAIRNPLTPFDDCLYNIFGPVNGLFLMNFYGHWTFPSRLALWNPATGELSNLTLPAIKRPLPNGGFWNNRNNGFRLGFGLDLLTNDHKVVWIQFLKDFEIPFRPRRGVVSLYNVTNDSWKEIDTDLADDICSSKLTTYMNGAYYWLSCNGPIMVLFDMSKEVFRDMEPPPCFNQKSKYGQYELMCCGDESIPLLVLVGWMRNSIDMWVMKGEGCWTKDFTVGLSPELYFPRVLCYPRGFLQNGRLLYHDVFHLRQLFSYNIHDREIQNLELSGHFIAVNYKESLASIKGGRKQRQTSPVTTA